MRPYRHTSTLQQMSVNLGVFAVLMLLLDSGGLYDWAQRLELGPERTIALPICTALHRAIAPLRIEKEREKTLIALARIGWSDDPALLASIHPASAPSPNTPGAPSSPTASSSAKVGSHDVRSPSTPREPIAHHTTPFAASAIALEEPPLLSTLPPLHSADATADPQPPNTPERITIALAGDSMMAVGLSNAILRDAPKYKNLDFINAFKSGTGLARPEVFNWQLEYPAMLKDAHPDFVIVAMGANDGQGFVQDKITYPFGTEGWQLLYEQRVDAFLRTLEKNGATVIWIGLPPMKDGTLASRMDQVNRIEYSVVNASPHAIWFSTSGLIGDTKGQFRDFGEVRGKLTRLRQGDGIHISDEGAELIAAKLLPWLASQPTK